MPEDESPLKLQPIRAQLPFGREIVGTSVAAILESTRLSEALRQAVLEHGMVLIRNQELTPEIEERVAMLFPHDTSVPVADRSGPFNLAGTGVKENSTGGASRWKVPSHPVVQLQGCGKIVDHFGIPDGEMRSEWASVEWHTDGIHDDVASRRTLPPVLTSMYVLETPAVGAETLFASGRAAFQNLSPELRERALRLVATYDCNFRPVEPNGTRARPEHVHSKDGFGVSSRWPVVITDRMGAPSLYMAPAFTRQVDDEGTPLEVEEGQSLLGKLLSIGLSLPEGWHAPADGSTPIPETDNVLVHQWRSGDLVLWDNRSMLHSATPTSRYNAHHPETRRLVHRIRLSACEPVNAAA